MSELCKLCESSVANTQHHLIPKAIVGDKTEKIPCCSDCQGFIHSQFTNKELARNLDTVEKLKNNPKVQKWIEWKKKRPLTTVKHRFSKSRRGKGRYA